MGSMRARASELAPEMEPKARARAFVVWRKEPNYALGGDNGGALSPLPVLRRQAPKARAATRLPSAALLPRWPLAAIVCVCVCVVA